MAENEVIWTFWENMNVGLKEHKTSTAYKGCQVVDEVQGFTIFNLSISTTSTVSIHTITTLKQLEF